MRLINNHKNETITSDLCPVTILPILQKPEWSDLDFGRDFRLTVRMVGNSILHSQPF